MLIANCQLQSGQVMAFGEMKRLGMVGRLGKGAHDAADAAGVGQRLGDDGAEELRRHRRRTGEGQKRAIWPQQFAGQQIDILVALGRPQQLSMRGGEFRRIQDDDVE